MTGRASCRYRPRIEIRGKKSLAELAKVRHLHPNQQAEWMNQFGPAPVRPIGRISSSCARPAKWKRSVNPAPCGRIEHVEGPDHAALAEVLDTRVVA